MRHVSARALKVESRRVSTWWRCLAVMCALGATLSHASEARRRLDAAQHEAQQARFEKARDLARSALEAGDAEVDTTWRIHAALGELEAITGSDANALRAFRTALVLAPTFSLPEGSSPRVLGPFTAARADAPALQLTLALAEGRATAQVVDALGVVQGARFELSGAPLPMRRVRDRFVAEVTCSATPCLASVTVLDEWGNALAHTEAELAPSAAIATPVVVATAEPKRSWLSRPGPWLVVASVAVLATAIGFGARSLAEQGNLDAMLAARGSSRFPDALALDAARQRSAAVFWIGLGVGALLGGGAALAW